VNELVAGLGLAMDASNGLHFWLKLVQLALLVFIPLSLLAYLPRQGIAVKGMRYGLVSLIAVLSAIQLYSIESKLAFAHYSDVEELHLNPARLFEFGAHLGVASSLGLVLQWLGILFCAGFFAKRWHAHSKRLPLLKLAVLLGISVLLVQDAYRNTYVLLRNTLNNLVINDDFTQIYPSVAALPASLFTPSQFGSAYSVIAHAGGGMMRTAADGEPEQLSYTNSLEAVEQSIRDGKKLIELDLLTTSDGELIAGHDWPRVKALLKFQGITERQHHDSSPLSFAEFSLLRQQSAIKPLDLAQIDAIFKAHPQLILVTDKTDNFPKLVQGFEFPERLIVECFSLYQCQRANRYGIVNTALNIQLDNADIVDYLQRNRISMVTFRGVEQHNTLQFERAKAIHDAGIVSLVYTSGDDLAYLQQHIGLTASAIYTDFFSLTSQTLIAP
jgi:glycerophosphoryl diester phosphodiesterase